MSFIFIVWTLAGMAGLSSQKDGKTLEYFNGLKASYKRNEKTTTVQFKLWPSRPEIYYIHCNTSNAINGLQRPILSWTDNKIANIGSQTDIINGSLTTDTFLFTLQINELKGQDQRCFFCKANTQKDLDRKGFTCLSRKIDPLQQVTGTTVALNQSQIFLTWRYFPRKADISAIKCYHKPSSAKRWVPIYEFNWEENSSKSMNTFARRVSHILTESQFTLHIDSATSEDEGIFDCEFESEGEQKLLKSSCNLVPFNSTYVADSRRSYSTKDAALGIKIIPIFTFLLGFLIGIGVVCCNIWRKSERKCPGIPFKCTRAGKTCKQEPCDENVGLTEESNVDNVDSGEQAIKDTPKTTLKDEKGKRKAKPKYKLQTSIEQTEIKDEPVTPTELHVDTARVQAGDSYILVVHGEEERLFCLDDDNTLSMETLQSVFPQATGLTRTGKEEDKQKVWVVRVKDKKLIPPKEGWGDRAYQIVCPAVSPDKQMFSPVVNLRSPSSVAHTTPVNTAPVQTQSTPSPREEGGPTLFDGQRNSTSEENA